MGALAVAVAAGAFGCALAFRPLQLGHPPTIVATAAGIAGVLLTVVRPPPLVPPGGQSETTIIEGERANECS